jgi:hypothetical protein
MHCYADLPSGTVSHGDSRSGDAGRAGGDPAPADPTTDTAGDSATTPSPGSGGSDHGGLLDPEGAVDNVLTVVVAIGGSIVVGFVGLIALLLITGSAWAFPVGFFSWLGGLAYLARQYSVQETVAKTFYAAAAVLLSMPLIAVSPAVTVEGGLPDRAVTFVALLAGVAFPAAILAGIGYVIMQFAPERK